MIQLVWPGKTRLNEVIDQKSNKTFKLIEEKSIASSLSNNLLIEGDSIDTLKMLSKTHSERVKCIYIDPPYNVGKDRIYKDSMNRVEWLDMIYPRLILAKSILKEDGTIFVSIDDHELANLRIIMDEIFGEENFEGIISWRRRSTQPNDKTKMIGKVAEFIVCFAKNSKSLRESGVGKLELTGKFTNPDNDLRGSWSSKPWKVGSGQSGTRYVITTPTGKRFDEVWMGTQETFENLLSDNRIVFPKKGDGLPRKKYFRSERESEGQCATNWWSHDEFGHNPEASKELENLFGVKNVFNNPKPVRLIKKILQIANVKGDDIVLDFFAGSGTTGEAVLTLNQTDQGNRSFIIVQSAESLCENGKIKKNCESAVNLGFETVVDITRERLIRSINKIASNAGFKYFKVEQQ